ncbi:MAG: FkbM family methyltransferase [Ignavibacteria bacterium]|nr:FkbM family methyltransferase [Ignavibacteria bacterium]
MIVLKNDIEFKVSEETNKFGWWHHYENEWETFILAAIDKYLNKDNCFLDVGAWNGAVSLYACQKCKEVYAFEPDDVAYQDLKENIELNNFKNIHLLNIALSDSKGKAKLYADQFGYSISSLINVNPEEYKSNEVETELLENIINKYKIENIGLIKIDIEGGEKKLIPNITTFLKSNLVPVHLSLHPDIIGLETIAKILEPLQIVYQFENELGEILALEEIIEQETSEILLINNNKQ